MYGLFSVVTGDILVYFDSVVLHVLQFQSTAVSEILLPKFLPHQFLFLSLSLFSFFYLESSATLALLGLLLTGIQQMLNNC